MNDIENNSIWEYHSIGSLLECNIDYRGKTPPKSKHGIPVLSAANVKNGKIDLSHLTFVSEELYNKWTTRGFPKPGDILITTEAPVGEVATFPGDRTYLITRRIIALRGKTGVLDNDFLKYSLLNPKLKAELLSYSRGSTVPRILKTDILNFQIPLPSLPTQHAIARILGSLDDKIELNRQMNDTLEAMARAIFRSWFVDFDPVRARAEGRQPAGMDAETAALFPSAMVEVDGREVPKGWGVCKIADVVGINEKSISREYPFTRIDYIEISSVTKGKLESSIAVDLKKAPSRAQRLVKHGDTIWSGVRPNRESYLFVQHPKENLVVSTGFVVLTPHKIPPTYLFSWVTTEDFVDYLTANADGSAYPAVRADHFANAELLIPSKQILTEFEKIVAPMRAKIHSNEQQSRTLGEIRDALLPKMMSGEIMVEIGEMEEGVST